MASKFKISDYGPNPWAGVNNNSGRKKWGGGWPNCSGAKTTVTGPSGAKVTVRKELAPLVAVLLQITHAEGYILRKADTGGFVCRPIGGTRIPSNHSYGIAIDLNWQSNPFSLIFKSDIPPAVIHAWEEAGFYWGGRYKIRKDCLTGDSMIVTEAGPRAIRDLAGQTVSMLSTNTDPRTGAWSSQWVKAPVESYGWADVYEVALRRRGGRTVVRTTGGHRWPLGDAGGVRFVETSDLKPGAKIPALMYPTAGQLPLDQDAVAQGIVWGDGSTYNEHGGRTPQATVQLCAEKSELRPFLEPHAQYWKNTDHGPRAFGLPASMKDIPDPESDISIVAGFFAGWFACDGHINPAVKVPPTLSTSDTRAVQWMHRVAPRLGLTITSVGVQKAGGSGFNSTKDNHQIAFRQVDERLLVRTKHRGIQLDPSRRYFGWTVESVRATGLSEEVFCPTVEGRHVVALATPTVPILTGQSMHVEQLFGPGELPKFLAIAKARLASLQGPAPVPAPTPVPVPPKPSTGRKLGSRTLKVGNTGADVAVLQRFLGIADDGRFGPITEAAVRRYQAMRKQKQTGIADAKTLAPIVKALGL